MGRIGKFLAAAVLNAVVFGAVCGAVAAADSPFASNGQLESYIESNRLALARTLERYNKEHRLVAGTSSRWKVELHSWQIDELGTNRAVVFMSFEVGDRNWGTTLGESLFELRWDGGSIEIAGHREGVPRAKAQPAAASTPTASTPTASTGAASTGAEGAAAVRPFEEVAAYLERNKNELERRLTAYNQQHKHIIPSSGYRWDVKINSWKIDRLTGDRAFVAIDYQLKGYWPVHGSALFELQWRGDELAFLSHGEIESDTAKAPGWLESGDDNCVYNYYAPRPCVDVVGGWTEFAETHGLSLDSGSAAIYQSYKHNDLATGDRLMARARGLPDPEGGSVFGLQAEVRAMNLGQYQRGSDEAAGCSLNPHSEKPCLEVVPIYQDFLRKHGLTDGANAGTLFEAYAQGDYRKADVIYALAKGLDVPAYGYIPTGVAREVAALRRTLDLAAQGSSEQGGCGFDPYMPAGDTYRPCPGVLELWRDFAERYQLEDNAQNARIFAQYADGEYRSGDQLLAQAKGVSLEQLLEAAGVPSKGLTIEVYPGVPQRMERTRTGT